MEAEKNENRFLLTIAIPTFNRSKFLKRCLEYLYIQKSDFDNSVEVIVSDNASEDDTKTVVDHYIQSGFDIKYIRNDINQGPDYNIAQCYTMAQGKYVLTLGDDDLLIKGAVKQLLKTLRNQYGVVFLNYGEYTGQKNLEPGDLKTTPYSSIDFLKRVSHFVTFISGNIVNKQYLDAADLMLHKGSCLIQVPFILNAILQSEKSLFINDKLLFAEPDNTGGYNLFKIFGANFNGIINSLKYADRKQIASVKRIINNDVLVKFFPQFILKFKSNVRNNFTKVDPLQELRPVFKGYFNFWLCCYPLCVLPYKVGLIYWYFVRVYSKLRTLILN